MVRARLSRLRTPRPSVWETSPVLNRAVARNSERFPGDFMFELTTDEAAALRSQSATSKGGRGGRRYRPLAFTEQGVAMLSSVLRSALAVPIESEGRLIGVLSLYGRQVNAFDETHRRIAELAAYATARSGISFAPPAQG